MCYSSLVYLTFIVVKFPSELNSCFSHASSSSLLELSNPGLLRKSAKQLLELFICLTSKF